VQKTDLALRPKVVYVAGQDGYPAARVLDGLAAENARVLTVLVGDSTSPRVQGLVELAAPLGPVLIAESNSGVSALADDIDEAWSGVPVIALSDDVLVHALRLGNKLGWTDIDAALVDTARHKYRARQLFGSAGILGPRFAIIRDVGSIAAATTTVGFPGVVKPVYGAGSSWVFRVNNEEELERFVTESWLEMASDAYVHRSQMADDTAFVYESYLVGVDDLPHPGLADYCSVEGIVVDGSARVLGISDRFWPCKPFRETGVVFPSLLPRDVGQEIVDVALDAVAAVGMRSGGFHVEIKRTPDGPALIEFNPRPGGPIPRMWERLTGGSFAREYLRALYGDPGAFDAPLVGACGEHLLYPDGESLGKLIKLDGLDTAITIVGVEDVERWRQVGDLVNPHEGDYSAVGRAWSHAPTPAEVVEVDRVLRQVVEATLSPDAAH
jgi:biotin carboxylase